MESINNQNIDRENPLCLSFCNVDAYLIEESGSKYLSFALTKKNKKVLGDYKKIWNKIKNQVKGINGDKTIKYKKGFVKIRLDLYDDELPLGKLLSFSVLNIVVKSVFQNESK